MLRKFDQLKTLREGGIFLVTVQFEYERANPPLYAQMLGGSGFSRVSGISSSSSS